MKKLLVVHLADSYGGAERLTESLLPLLSKNWSVNLVSNNPKIWNSPLSLVLPGHAFFPSWPEIIKQALILRKAIYKADLVLAVMHYSAFLTVLSSRLVYPKPPVIASLHGPIIPALYTVLKKRRRFFWTVAKFICLLSDQIIVPSFGLKQELVTAFGVPGSKCHCVPNGVELKNIHRKKLSSFWPRSKRRLVWVGRLAEEKTPQKLLPILKEIENLPWHLAILGEGPLKKGLKQNFSKLGLSNKISWQGFQKNIYPYLFSADIFLHTCLFEGFGLAILEAMASGCAIVAEDCPYGPQELLDHGKFGFLVKTKKDWLWSLRTLINQKETLIEYKKIAQRRARDFPLSRTLQSYLKIFNLQFQEQNIPL